MSIVKLYPLTSKPYVYLRNKAIPFKEIEKYVPKKGVVVDVGCGYGALSIYLALKSEKRTVFGFDCDKRRISIAKKAGKKIRNVCFKIKDICKDQSVKRCDVILLVDILHHLPFETQDKFLKECYKKLNKNGLLIIKDVNEKPRIKFHLNHLCDSIMTRGKPLYFLNIKEFKKKLKEIDFKIKEKKIGHLIYPHVMLVCEK